MDAWIDTYHAVRRLTRQGTFVFLTDSAIGSQEEDNLRHLITNLGTDVPRERIVPFLTAKHSRVLRVLRGAGASDRLSRRSSSSAATRASARRGAWSTPGSSARCCAATIRHCASAGGPIRTPIPNGRPTTSSAPDFNAEFYLTQVVSHHEIDRVARS